MIQQRNTPQWEDSDPPLQQSELSEEIPETFDPEDQEEVAATSAGGFRTYFMSSFSFQIILCLFVAIVLILLNTFYPHEYQDIAKEIQKTTQADDGFTDDVQSVWSTLSEFLLKEKEPVSSEVPASDWIEPESGLDNALLISAKKQETNAKQTQAGGEPTEEEESVVPANATTKPISYNGNIASPLKTKLQVTSEYGVRTHPVTGEADFHTGIDFPAKQGAPILAIADGTVSVVTESNGYGKYLKLEHSDGTASLYAHCSKITVKEGQKVKLGDSIAKVGSTGMSTGPHLHLSFFIDQTFVNPADILKNVGD